MTAVQSESRDAIIHFFAFVATTVKCKVERMMTISDMRWGPLLRRLILPLMGDCHRVLRVDFKWIEH